MTEATDSANLHLPDIPEGTRGLLTGKGHVVEYFVVSPDSPYLRGQDVNTYVKRDLSRLVVSSALKDRPSFDVTGKSLTQSEKMLQFLEKRKRDRIRKAVKRGKFIIPREYSPFLSKEKAVSDEIQAGIERSLHGFVQLELDAEE